jgi:hypothetical protein
MPGSDRDRPDKAAPTDDLPDDDRSPAKDSSGDRWLAEYPEWVREAVHMDKRRRAASLRLEPLPSGKRDPRDLVASDAPSNPEAA